jgi:hypothetical protein
VIIIAYLKSFRKCSIQCEADVETNTVRREPPILLRLFNIRIDKQIIVYFYYRRIIKSHNYKLVGLR